MNYWSIIFTSSLIGDPVTTRTYEFIAASEGVPDSFTILDNLVPRTPNDKIGGGFPELINELDLAFISGEPDLLNDKLKVWLLTPKGDQ